MDVRAKQESEINERRTLEQQMSKKWVNSKIGCKLDLKMTVDCSNKFDLTYMHVHACMCGSMAISLKNIL